VHEAVVPDEVVAADLRNDPPALATLQAGADDIDFAACLEALLGAPSQFAGANTCVRPDARGDFHLTPRASAELGSLRLGLTRAIETIQGAAPHAQILILNYYQLIPEPQVDLQGTTALCRSMRAHGRNPQWRIRVWNEAEFVQDQLNSVIASAAERYPGVALVDIAGVLSGHEFCTADTWLFSGVHDAGHPTAIGQRYIAQAALDRCSTLPRRCIGR
jgi:hypothetical protein